MSDRRDRKGRILRPGESQRADGQYMYRYTDALGDRRTVYSWTLVSTDKVPKGKRSKIALRDMEKQIVRDVDDGIVQNTLTVAQAYQNMMEIRVDLRTTTKSNYNLIFNTMIAPKLGNRTLASLRHSTIEKFYLSLARERGYSASTILVAHNIVYLICERAVEDNIIRSNPAANAFGVISKSDVARPPVKREALTVEQQTSFVNYVYGTKATERYGNLFTVLLGTGMRIGEALGLRVCDCDFEANMIRVTHSLVYKQPDGEGYRYMILRPKTPSGYRTIPMMAEVKTALLREINEHRNNTQPAFEVDGYTDFIFLNQRGKGMRASRLCEVLKQIQHDHNCVEKMRAIEENRQPILLPHISPHVLRHTFCTRLCEQGQNIKVIQDVMGHKHSATTLDVYAHATDDIKAASFAQLDGKIKLA